MSMFVAAIMFIPLLAIGLAHLVWSFGGTWPLRNRDLLVRTVYGRPTTTAMPSRLLLFLLCIVFIGIGVVALALADHNGGGVLLSVLGVALGLFFLARGFAGYTARWRQTFNAEPFATLDRKNYSPLALMLGVGFLLLVLLRYL